MLLKWTGGEMMANKFSKLDQYYFGQGTHYELYKKLGAHFGIQDGRAGILFAVWAPHAKTVSVVGDFNHWNRYANIMMRKEPLGVHTAFVPEARVGSVYKYCIETKDGTVLYKSDPFARATELRPKNASVVTDNHKYKWTDSAWMKARTAWDCRTNPVSIYEVHIGSWKKHPNRPDAQAFYNYREFAVEATKYVKEMGYTHIELMGIAEHPYDGSWGYQVTGYFAPTSRYGTAEDFAYMINYFHKNKIGVILDWVPAHFAKDEYGLSCFDGAPLFEYADARKGEQLDWGTKVFDYSKPEVRNFLIANALYWIEHFHVDGLRVDAVASMLYLDYGRKYDEWIANEHGGNHNLEAISFLKHLNSIVADRHPGVMMIAEESTAFPKVTGALADGGLGFQMKWNMGWMHDFLEYMKVEPSRKKEHHNTMTLPMTYAYNEEYVLVLSHDEVVHLKGSLLEKMPGNEAEKFANLKVGYAYMMGHPGRKLLFMGQDFGQVREWSESRELDWYLLAEPQHGQMQRFTKDLLHLYKNNRALYECESGWDGFQWINAADAHRSIFSFTRHSKNWDKNLLFVCNFTPTAYADYRVGVPVLKEYKLIINSDDKKYGGSGKRRPSVYHAEWSECDGKDYSFAYSLPAYGVAVFEF